MTTYNEKANQNKGESFDFFGFKKRIERLVKTLLELRPNQDLEKKSGYLQTNRNH